METLRDLGSIAVLALRHAMLLAQARAATSELRTSEERFRLLVDGVKDYAIFLMDPAGNVTSWNQGAQRIKGYQAEEVLGRHLSTFYPAEDVAAGIPARGLRVAEQQGQFEAEGWRVRKDGSRFWASIVITALRDEAGRLSGFAKITRDITERKKIQDQLVEAERREAAKFREHADRMAILEETKSQFLKLAMPDHAVPVNADRKRLSMILHKLLDNAIKYSPDGGEIACEVLVLPGWAELDVRDQGLGLEPAQLDQLFRRFGRIVTDETADIRGSGLGLYLARETARLHGGDITVESEPGRGSTFSIRIPLADTMDRVIEAVHAGARTRNAGGPSWQGRGGRGS